MGGSAWYALLVHALHPLPVHCFNGVWSVAGKFQAGESTDRQTEVSVTEVLKFESRECMHSVYQVLPRLFRHLETRLKITATKLRKLGEA